VDPNLIVLGEAPGKTELEDGVPFVGRAGELLRDILSGVGARPVIVNSANCFNEDKPTTEVITACREAYVKPTLDKYPGLPILSLGNFAASSILGGNRAIGKLAGKVRVIGGRNVYFTFHPAYYLYSHEKYVKDHIEVMAWCSVTPVKPIEYIVGVPPKDILKEPRLFIDAETTGLKYPWYGTKVTLLGVSGLNTPIYIIPTSHQEYKEDVDCLFLNEFEGEIVGHNIAVFDLPFLAYEGLKFPKARFFDTEVVERCRPIIPKMTGLKWLGKKFFGTHAWEAQVHTWIDEGLTTDKMPFKDICTYLAWDIEVSRSVWLSQLEEIGDGVPF